MKVKSHLCGSSKVFCIHHIILIVTWILFCSCFFFIMQVEFYLSNFVIFFHINENKIRSSEQSSKEEIGESYYAVNLPKLMGC